MSGDIVERLGLVVCPCNDAALVHYDSAHGDLSLVEGCLSLAQCQSHIVFVGHHTLYIYVYFTSITRYLLVLQNSCGLVMCRTYWLKLSR